jgi:uncharacterized protein (DUF2235 family)
MAKNVVLCCDGTANEFARDKTNVIKLYSVLEQDPKVQATYYHPGLGTMEPAGALSPFRRRFTRLLGKAIGYGLENDVRDAYVFIMQTFQPDDKLFLFGFSRGAYTVRAVASLLHMYGLLRPGNESLVPYAIRMMTAIQRAPKDGTEREKVFEEYSQLAKEFKATMSCADCRPWFVGVWDTVSSVGWVENPLKLPFVTDNPDIEIGRHAIAIDERRAFFRTHLWRPGTDPRKPHGPKDLVQVWFPGVHCDVGGGYPEKESGLSKIALAWMLDEAEQHGLKVVPGRKAEMLGQSPGNHFVTPNANGDMHESLKGFWNIAEFIPKRHFDWKKKKEGRRMNLFRRRTIPPGSLIHHSAYDRGADYAKRLPDNVTRV